MLPCLSGKSKFYLSLVYQQMKSPKLLDAVSKVDSNLETFKDMGKVCSKVVLFFIIGNPRDSVKLGNCSK